MNSPANEPQKRAHVVRLGKYRLRLPGAAWLRRLIGAALVILGIFGFLPVLGFWMIPLGLLVLSVDSHPVRVLRRRIEVWWGRRRKAKAKKAA